MKKVFISIFMAALTLSAYAAQTARVTIQLTSTDATYGMDELELKENTDRTAAYESGYDAEKMMSQANKHSVLLYAFVGDQACSTVATNNLDGTVIGFTTNKYDTDYKLVFSNVSGRELKLYDRVLKTTTTIENSLEYSFTATEGRVAVNDRFVINYVAPTYVYMNGDFDNPGGSWDTWPGSFTADGSIYSQELTLAADEWYHFKLIEEYSPDKYTAADGSSFDRDNNSHNLYVNEFTSALLLHTDVAGTYTFTWNDLTDNLTITFPAAPAAGPQVTTNAYGWASFSYDQNLLPQDASLKIYAGNFDGVETLSLAVKDYVAANEGVIVYGEPSTTYYFNVGNGSDSFAGNSLKPSSAWESHTGTIYCLKGDALYEYTGATMPANKAYLEVSVSGPNPTPRRISLHFNEAQGVENVAPEAVKAVKFVGEDGQILIKKGEEVYNLQGQIVK